MHARLSIVSSAPERSKEIRSGLEATVPKVREVPGLQGAVYAHDASSGRIAVLTLFGSREEIEASREAAQRIREGAVAEMGATIESVDEYEVIGTIGGSSEGASHARLTVIDGPSERAAEARTIVTEEVIPAARGIAGLLDGYWLADEARGRFTALTLFASEGSLQDSRVHAERLRQAAVEKLGATVRSVEELEVVATI